MYLLYLSLQKLFPLAGMPSTGKTKLGNASLIGEGFNFENFFVTYVEDF